MATMQEIPLPLRSAGDESFEQELGYLSVEAASFSGQPIEELQSPSPSTTGTAGTLEQQLPASQAEEPLIEKVLPPIKTRRDVNEGDSRAPELSPPPSPKRMRELVRKTSLKNLAFSPVRARGDSL